MDIQAEKKWIVQELQKLEDEHLISIFKNLLSFVKKNKSSLKPMSMKQYYSMIEESERDFQEGRVTAHEDVVKYYKKKR